MTLLFILIVLVGLGVVGFVIYAGGALLSRPQKQHQPISRVEYLVLPVLPSLPPTPTRIGRGTTPQPLSQDASSPFGAGMTTPPIPGVITNRDDSTERMVQPDDRFSIQKSRH